MDIQNYSGMCFVDMKTEVFLVLRKQRGTVKNNFHVYRPTEVKTRYINLEDIVSIAAGESSKGDIGDGNQVSADLVKQIIFVLFDVSGSMYNPVEQIVKLNGKTMDSPDRLDVAKEFFVIFSNKVGTVAKQLKIGLITFGEEVIVNSQLREVPKDFQSALDHIEVSGSTALFLALQTAIDILVQEKPKYPSSTTFRIVLLTDGNDCEKGANPYGLYTQLFKHKILLDTFLITNDFDHPLVALSYLSGGCCFYNEDPYQMALNFEQDEFINPSLRNFTILNSEIPLASDEEQFDDFASKYEEYLNKGLEMKPLQDQNEIKCKTIKTVLVEAENNSNPIIDELHDFYLNPKDYLVVFPTEKLTNWMVAILGPQNSPYKETWWGLSVEFPEDYPNNPPDFRFLKAPYHVNISREGIIYSEELNSFQITDHVIDLFDKIRDLMSHPNWDNPVDEERRQLKPEEWGNFQNVKLQNYNTNHSEKSAQKWIDQWNVQQEKIGEILLQPPIFVPRNLRCPISGEKMNFPVQASTGIIFDRDSLVQLLLLDSNALCPVTGKFFNLDLDLNLNIHEETMKQLQEFNTILEKNSKVFQTL